MLYKLLYITPLWFQTTRFLGVLRRACGAKCAAGNPQWGCLVDPVWYPRQSGDIYIPDLHELTSNSIYYFCTPAIMSSLSAVQRDTFPTILRFARQHTSSSTSPVGTYPQNFTRTFFKTIQLHQAVPHPVPLPLQRIRLTLYSWAPHSSVDNKPLQPLASQVC